MNEHINDDRLDDLVAQLNIIENKLIDPMLAFNYLQDWFISFLKNRALINSQNQTLVNIVKIREVSEYNGMIYVDGKELKISKDLSSQEVNTDMLPYKHELLRAYGDAENTTVKTESELNNIPEMYLMDYKEQRHNFLNAEYVRRSFREIFVDADTNFDILKNELIKNLNRVRGPFEYAMRLLMILGADYQSEFSSSRLASLDFMITYSKYFKINEINLHPDSQYKFSEYAARLQILSSAINYLVVNNLINVQDSQEGFLYKINERGLTIYFQVESEYYDTYALIASDTIEKMKRFTNQLLVEHIRERRYGR
ncbi:ABC-three component system middle component 2 [Kandleria vitulina]|nr:ABC-three component system middle component 2 [Kandleria vitulina]